jgi:hypothetical protein
MIRVPRPTQQMSPFKLGQNQARKRAQTHPRAADILPDLRSFVSRLPGT